MESKDLGNATGFENQGTVGEAILCDFCGTKRKEHSKYCAGCGRQLDKGEEKPEAEGKGTGSCKSCGAPVNDKYCTECGTLGEEYKGSVSSSSGGSKLLNKRNVFIAAAIVISAILLFVFSFSSGPERVVRDYIKALNARDLDTLQEISNMYDGINRGEFTDDLNERNLKVKIVEISDVSETKDDKATVTGTFETKIDYYGDKDTTKQELVFYLVKKDSSWIVVNIGSN